METHSSRLTWRIPGQSSLVDYSPFDDTEELEVTEVSEHANMLRSLNFLT